MEYIHRCTEAHYKQPSLLCSSPGRGEERDRSYTVTLAQLETVVLIKEAIKLAFFRLVEYLEHQRFWVRLQAKMAIYKDLSSESRQSIL